MTTGTGGTTASYTTADTNAADDGAQFRCLVSNTGGSVASNTATLTFNPLAPVITGQPLNQTVTEGLTATFSVTATGLSLAYQWQRFSVSAVSWVNVTNGTGGTTATYTTAATTAGNNGAQYRCLVSNTEGSATSDTATLTINPTGWTAYNDGVYNPITNYTVPNVTYYDIGYDYDTGPITLIRIAVY